VWHLGPFPIRAYALCIVAGILVALWLTSRRMVERGGTSEDVWDISGWAVVFGIIGGRLYHLITDPELYFEGKPGTHPIDALKIWDGGLGIWGAVALGGVGALIGCRRKGVKWVSYADAVAPGLVLAQGIGRWGNWFNNELYGGPTKLPWGLQIHCIDITVGKATAGGIASGGERCAAGATVLAQHYQPTFLYESIWDIALAFVVIWVDRKYRLGRGNVLAFYVMGYTLGRVWIEALRTDPANHILGLRLNIWTCFIVFIIGAAWFVKHGRLHAAREESPYTDKRRQEEAARSEEANRSDGSVSVGVPLSVPDSDLHGQESVGPAEEVSEGDEPLGR
jgi:prolipoprotein diacylglyceryl transferase